MAGCITIELCGGPADGHVVRLAELRDVYLMPCPLRTILSTPDLDTMHMPVAVYEPIRDPAMGRPSRDDQGKYRYRYVGER